MEIKLVKSELSDRNMAVFRDTKNYREDCFIWFEDYKINKDSEFTEVELYIDNRLITVATAETLYVEC